MNQSSLQSVLTFRRHLQAARLESAKSALLIRFHSAKLLCPIAFLWLCQSCCNSRLGLLILETYFKMLCQQQAICKQPENWLTIYIALQNFAQHIAHCIIMLILSRSFKQEGKAQLSHVYRHEGTTSGWWEERKAQESESRSLGDKMKLCLEKDEYIYMWGKLSKSHYSPREPWK